MSAKDMHISPSQPHSGQEFPRVWVSEKDGVRRLHIGSDTVQSLMRVDRPFDLDVDYLRKIMAFLLFRPDAKRVLIIGLGGGSLAKFIHRRLPAVNIDVVEINPGVVETARERFLLPPDDGRLHIHIADGVEYVAASPARHYDVILVDGSDADGPCPELCSADFYTSCRTALDLDGVLVSNLWLGHSSVAGYNRMTDAFSCFTFVLRSPEGNLVAFALKWGLWPVRWDDLEARAHRLEVEYGLEFVSFANCLSRRVLEPGTAIRHSAFTVAKYL